MSIPHFGVQKWCVSIRFLETHIPTISQDHVYSMIPIQLGGTEDFRYVTSTLFVFNQVNGFLGTIRVPSPISKRVPLPGGDLYEVSACLSSQ